jgi:hypothetical protein
MRALCLGLVVAACGSSSTLTDGGGDDDDAAAGDGGIPVTCDAPPLFDDGIQPLRTLHVDATAAPGGDGSAGAPFATLEDAAAGATPGTAIRLAPGTHTTGQFLANLRGTEAAPIWIGGDPAQPLPAFDGGAQAMQLSRAAFVVVHDLEITGATANGINLDDGGEFADDQASHHVALVRVFVHDIGTGGNNDCIKVSGINDLAIYDSRIERCGSGGSGIDHVGCHRSIIARNTFDGAMATAVQAKGGSTDIDIRQNRIRISGQRAINLGGSTDLNLFRPPLSTTVPNAEARRVRAYANLITGLTDQATAFAFVGCVDCLAAYNLVRGTPRFGLRILQETASTGTGFPFEPANNGRVIANSFVFEAGSFAAAVNVGSDTEASSFTFAANLWHATDDATLSTPDLPTPETGSVIGQGTGYTALPDDPRAALGQTCVAAPEAGAGVDVPEVNGAVDGECMTAPRSIGPQNACAR